MTPSERGSALRWLALTLGVVALGVVGLGWMLWRDPGEGPPSSVPAAAPAAVLSPSTDPAATVRAGAPEPAALPAPVPARRTALRADVLAVEVVDEDGAALPGVVVEGYAADRIGVADDARTDAAGWVRLSMARPLGRVLVNPRSESAPGLTEELVAVDGGRELRVVLRDRTARLLVRAVDDVGGPVPGLGVVVHWAGRGDDAEALALPRVPIPRMTLMLPEEPLLRVAEEVDQRRRPVQWGDMPRTDARGEVRVGELPAGPVGVAVIHGSQSFQWTLPTEWKQVLQLRRGSQRVVEFVLARRGRVRVTVEGDVQPGFEARVRGRSEAGDGRFDARLRRRRPSERPFEEDVCDAGSYVITLQVAPDQPYDVRAASRIDVAPGQTTDLVLLARREVGTLIGEVVADDGTPLHGVRLALAPVVHGLTPRYATTKQGRFSFSGLMDVHWTLTCDAKRAGVELASRMPVVRSGLRPSGTGFRVIVPLGYRVVGTALAPDGSPRNGGMVRLARAGEEHNARVRPDGSFSFRHIGAGRCWLTDPEDPARAPVPVDVGPHAAGDDRRVEVVWRPN